MNFPSGLNATDKTTPEWPFNSCTNFPADRSHTIVGVADGFVSVRFFVLLNVTAHLYLNRVYVCVFSTWQLLKGDLNHPHHFLDFRPYVSFAVNIVYSSMFLFMIMCIRRVCSLLSSSVRLPWKSTSQIRLSFLLNRKWKRRACFLWCDSRVL